MELAALPHSLFKPHNPLIKHFAAILLMLSREELAARARIKREPFEDAPAIRAARFDAYTRLAAEGRFDVIDAEQPIEEVTRAILDVLREA